MDPQKMDNRICPYCHGPMTDRCCHRMRKNVAEPIPFHRYFSRPQIGTVPSRQRRKRKPDSTEDSGLDDAFRHIEDARSAEDVESFNR